VIEERLERCARLLGAAGIERLAGSRVAIVGLGGVGSFCAEALARSGVGRIRIVDHDVVTASNCNRQLLATRGTLGRVKVEVMADRLREVAPGIEVDARREFFAAETAEALLGGGLDAVVDAIDSLGPKVELLHQCQRRGLFVTAALGAGGRLDPTRIRLAPLASTHADPLGVQVRKQLRRRGSLEGIDAAFSVEKPRPPAAGDWDRVTTDLHRGRQRVIQPSVVMVPAAMGMAIAAHVVARLAGLEQ
jgi:tRNA A37 threonylcarbamoyladenosine dehydratase